MLHTDSGNKAITIQGLAPLIQVFDMPASLHFYRDQIGFEVIGKSLGEGDNLGWVLLKLNEVELMLNTAYDKGERPPLPDPMRILSHGDMSIYFGCPDVDGAFAHLIAKGLDINKPAITGYGFKAITITDPDGFSLVFHWPVS